MKEGGLKKTYSTPQCIANRYIVHEELGRGGMAVVYRVTDTADQRQIALKKLLTRDNTKSWKFSCELFEQEYYTLAQLAHPRVVEVYDFGFDEREPYYTMELLDGGDLQHLAPIPWQKSIYAQCSACCIQDDWCIAISRRVTFAVLRTAKRN
jgi:serine/threonine protein kinase